MARHRLAVVATHPVQYHAPLYRALAARGDLHVEVLFAHRQDAQGQARAGYGVPFDWDVPLLDGYASRFLTNQAARPDASTFLGCDIPSIGAVLDAGRFDALLVHGWASRAYWQAIAAARRRGLRTAVRGDSQVATPRSAIRRGLKRLLYPLALDRAFDAFLAVGRRAREYYLHYGIAAERIHPSPHCVDNERFARGADEARARRAETRERLGLRAEGVVVLFVGRLVGFKRPGDLVEAASALGRRGVEVELLVAGAGPLEVELLRRARELGVSLRCAGFVNQAALPAIYAAADLLALPSDAQETWGLVCNEAMASGLPLVVSDAVGCAPDLVVPGVTGGVHGVGDIAGLAAAIERTVGLRGAGAKAREHIAAYSPEAAARGVVGGLFGPS